MTGIGQRILERRKALGLTQAELASKLGVAASACSQWEAEVMRPNGDNILALAKVLQVQPAWVTTGHSAHGVAELGEPNLDFTQVPVIDIMTLTPSFSVGKHSGDIRVLRSTTADVSPKAFSIQVEGDAMSNPLGAPSFPAGMFIIIDPTVEPQSGNFVVACLGGKGRGGLFKKYVVDGPHKFLQSLNPNFQMIELDKKATILGVAIRAEVDLV
jgi:SOS-response transcriptional repressor LexA